MTDDLISVIIPVYNVELYLEKCVDSILNQTYKKLEIILVDDGSTDSSSKICDEYKKKDKRIKVIHKKNGGLSDARNCGLDIAKGNYITFVDSDDFVNLKMIELFYDVIKKYGCDIVFGGALDYKNINMKESNISSDLNNVKEYSKIEILKLINTTMVNRAYPKLYKKEIFDDIRFPVGLIYEDSFSAPYIYEKVEKVIVIPYIVYYRYINPSSITHLSFSKKNYDLIKVSEDRIKFYENSDDELIILSYKFAMSNMISLYKKAYSSNVLKNSKKEVLGYYRNYYKTIKSKLNIKDKIKYKLFCFIPNIMSYVLNKKGN